MEKRKPRKNDLTFVCYVLKENSEAVPFESLTEEERKQFRQNMARRLSGAMSDYYTQHLDEFARL